MRLRLSVAAAAMLLMVLWLGQEEGGAVPYFARRYKQPCTTCHVIPPKLNQFGEDFLARGYRFLGDPPQERTWPFAVWATWRGQVEASRDRGRGLPNRVEIISGGPVGRPYARLLLSRVAADQPAGGQ